MRLIRSWPQRIPPGRNYVVDDVERLVITNHDYRTLGAVEDDVLLLEWDIAVSLEDRALFTDRALVEPDRVLVAPYRLYTPRPVWAHRRVVDEERRPVETGDPFCNLFGLGMVYLPRAVIEGFLASGWSNHFGDVELSLWHFRHVTPEVPICWQVWPVHLNHPGYLIEGVPTMAKEDPMIAALLRERDALLRAGKKDRAEQVETELKNRGYKGKMPEDGGDKAPRGRSARPQQTTAPDQE